MLTPSYGARLAAMIERLETVKAVVDTAVMAREDRKLIQALEDGSYGDAELDLLFTVIEKPLRAAVTAFAAGNRDVPVTRSSFDPGDDCFYRAVDMLSRREYSSEDEVGLPKIDLLNFDSEDEGLGRKGRAQVGLVRRLIRKFGVERIESMIQPLLEGPETVHFLMREPETGNLPQVKTGEEVARLLSLVRPIERDHMFPILYFRSPTGRVVHSMMIGNTQCVPSYYMGVDK